LIADCEDKELQYEYDQIGLEWKKKEHCTAQENYRH